MLYMKNATSMIVKLMLLLAVCFLLVSNVAWSFSKTDNQKAMEFAEQQSNGKAIGAKFIQKGNKQGYKVRIIKDGKVRHLFIALEQLQN